MKNKTIVLLLSFAIFFSAIIFARNYIEFQREVFVAPQPILPFIPHKEKLASSMNETETIRYLMGKIYNSVEFIPDESEQLPSVWNEIVKNRLLWKPTVQELVKNPNWVLSLNGYREDKAPKGYFIASPVLFHTYNNQGVAYATMFAQTATDGYSHVSGSDMGVGIFKGENDTWEPIFISKNMNNGFGASGDAGTLSPFLIGKNTYAYKNELTNMGQGAITYHTDLYYFDGIKFSDVLSTGTYGSDGTDCVSKGVENEWNGTLDLRTEGIAGSSFYDIIAEHGGTRPEGTNGECHAVFVKKWSERYHWDGTKYKLAK